MIKKYFQEKFKKRETKGKHGHFQNFELINYSFSFPDPIRSNKISRSLEGKTPQNFVLENVNSSPNDEEDISNLFLQHFNLTVLPNYQNKEFMLTLES